jgi:hypothetical protein
MGTRSLTVIKDEKQEIAVLYRQYDGYPSGHGLELADFLKPFTVVNGLSGNKTNIANGMPCLAAQIIAHFKSEPGQFYLHAAGSRDLGEEYIYTVYYHNKTLCLKVQAGAMTFFGLPGSKQDSMNVIYDGPVANFEPKLAEKNESELPAPKNDWAADGR